VTTRDHNTRHHRLFAQALDYLKSTYAVRHLLVATIVFLLAFVIIMLL
jgi:hypothetical protein